MAVSPQEANKISNLRSEVLDLKSNVILLRNKLDSLHLPQPPSSVFTDSNTKNTSQTKIIVVVVLLYVLPLTIFFLFFYEFGCAPLSILLLGYLICIAIGVLGIFQLLSIL
jgi:hypothetical protein